MHWLEITAIVFIAVAGLLGPWLDRFFGEDGYIEEPIDPNA